MTSALGFRAAAPEKLGCDHKSPAGELTLRVSRAGARSHASARSFDGVLRLMRPLYLDGSGQVTFVVMNPGGAYFGERYVYEVDVEASASLLLCNQSATRVHRASRPAVQEMTLTLGEGARLEYLPEPVIAYPEADYRQRTTIVADPSATAFCSEIVTPGWAPDGARFRFAGVLLRTQVCAAGGGLVAVDAVRVEPHRQGVPPQGLGHFDGFTHLGSALVLGPHCDESYARALRDLLAGADAEAGVTCGTRHGVSWVMVRALAGSTGELQRLLGALDEHDRSVTTGQAVVNLRRY